MAVYAFVGAFEKLRKATITFVVSDLPWARQSVRVEQLGLHRTYFDEI
jgi:hypothetical protein